MALWQSLRSLLCLFYILKMLFYIFFQVTAIHIHLLVRLSDAVIHLQFVIQRPFSVSRQTICPDDNTQLYAQTNLLSYITMDLKFVKKR